MKTAKKIVNNLINENMESLKGKLIKTRWVVIFGDNQFLSKHTFQIQNSSVYLFQLDLIHFLIC